MISGIIARSHTPLLGLVKRQHNIPTIINITTRQMVSSSKKNAAELSKLSVREFFEGLRQPTIVTLCGSQRVGSFNKILHESAVTELKKNGADVKPINLSALNLPIFNPNDEDSNFPQAAVDLKAELVASDGILITCPEYNGFVTPLLYNALTWATRGEGGMYDGFKGKPVSVMATSPGAMGGLRMIRSLTTLLQDMGANVIPGHNSIGSAFKVFDVAEGTIRDETTIAKIETACGQLVYFSRYQANRERDCAVALEVMKMANMGEYGNVDN